VLARTVTHALFGLEARRVEVEAHLQGGVPGLAIVGLADRACQEAKERVKSGIKAAELEWPRRRIVVNLAPAALKKEGSGFDLPIALAIPSATCGQVPSLRCRCSVALSTGARRAGSASRGQRPVR
jgi:magnesium chelatase family protein